MDRQAVAVGRRDHDAAAGGAVELGDDEAGDADLYTAAQDRDGDENHRLYAVDLKTGKTIWKGHISGRDPKIGLGSDGTLYAVEFGVLGDAGFGPGRVVRVTADGPETVLGDLPAPYALAQEFRRVVTVMMSK